MKLGERKRFALDGQRRYCVDSPEGNNLRAAIFLGGHFLLATSTKTVEGNESRTLRAWEFFYQLAYALRGKLAKPRSEFNV